MTWQGSIELRSDKGTTAVLTVDRDSAGAQVIRGRSGGSLSHVLSKGEAPTAQFLG